MIPPESKFCFEQLVANSLRSVETLNAIDAAHFMLEFYRQVRVPNCPIESDGDMILFQWGAYDFGEGETYRYNITRQFIVPSNEADADDMSQLSLTVHFEVTEALAALKRGNRWCSAPDQADELEQFIRDHEATDAVVSLMPLRTTLVWSAT